MNKKEIEAKLHNYEERLKDITKAIKELREQLAESEKPKLRHGNFGINQDGMYRITLYSNGESVGGNLGQRDDYCPTGKVSDSDITVFGNVFDLMKGWDKPFESWESKPAYSKAIQIIIEVTESGIFFGNSGDGATFDLENITEIYNKLGHAIAELKRNKEISGKK